MRRRLHQEIAELVRTVYAANRPDNDLAVAFRHIVGDPQNPNS
jgi:hypothetical protein